MPARFDLGNKPHLGYTDSVLDRAAELRHDPAALAALEADPRARALVIGGELVVVRKGAPLNDPAFTLAQAGALAPPRERAFLGRRDDAPLFAVAIDPDAAAALKGRDDLLVTDLRSIATGALVAQEHLPPLAEAKALLGWHARHRFCSKCGAPTRPVSARVRFSFCCSGITAVLSSKRCTLCRAAICGVSIEKTAGPHCPSKVHLFSIPLSYMIWFRSI